MKHFVKVSEEREFVDKHCRECDIYKSSPEKVIGWEVKTPVGMFRISGCIGKEKMLCPYRHTQSIAIGINAGEPLINLWSSLDMVLEGLEKFTEKLKEDAKKVLFFGQEDKLLPLLEKSEVPEKLFYLGKLISQSYSTMSLEFPAIVDEYGFPKMCLSDLTKEENRKKVASIEVHGKFGYVLYNICFWKECICFYPRVMCILTEDEEKELGLTSGVIALVMKRVMDSIKIVGNSLSKILKEFFFGSSVEDEKIVSGFNQLYSGLNALYWIKKLDGK